MHLSDLLGQELAAYRARTGREALTILETGTIRNAGCEFRQNDGWSTLTFAEEVRDHGGHLISVDLDTSVAAAVLDDHGLTAEGITLVEGHSVDVLAGALAAGNLRLDVALLDSDNDSALILHEWFVVRHLLRPGGLLLVDDVNLDSEDVVKGHQLAPWLTRQGIGFRLARRDGDGYSTGVLILET